jgi:hypothetical protein
LKEFYKKLIGEIKESNFSSNSDNVSGLIETGILELFIHIHPNLLTNIRLHTEEEIVSNLDNKAGGRYIKLPKAIEKTNSIINIKNNDKKCFFW